MQGHGRQRTNKHKKSSNCRRSSYLDQFTKKWSLNIWSCRPGIEQNVNILFKEDKWEIRDFQELKDELNTVKSQLNDFNLEEWHKHTNAVNIGRDIIRQIKYLIAPEFLTQAWCKFTEITAMYNLVPANALTTGHFNSVHLSEAPGAFILSLNHYLQSNYLFLKWHWMATTLNPYYEGNSFEELINDDRFLLHTLPKWNFGENYTGDLMCLENMLSIVSHAKNLLHNKIMLVTADGSIDCQLDPSEQEMHVAALKYCETIAALHLLQPGGNFVIKLFTLFECETLCLLNLLSYAFKSMEFFKPIKSKGGNSEVYLICLDYVGQTVMEPWLSVLRERYGRDIAKKALFPQSFIKTEFLQQIYQCASYFMKNQTMVIQFNVRTFKAFSKYDEAIIEDTCLRVAREYIPFYGLKRIGVHQMLIGSDILKLTSNACSGGKSHEGTFSGLKQKTKMKPSQNLRCLRTKVEALPNLWDYPGEVVKVQVTYSKLMQLQVQLGRPVHTLKSSRFCQRQILKLYLEVASLVSRKLSDNNKSELFPGFKKCDVSQYPWETNVAEAQRQSVLEISKGVENLKESDSFCIIGLSLLTQFSVGFIYLLGQSFNHVDFMKPTTSSATLVFVSFTRASNLSWLSELNECLVRQKDKEKTVHSFLPVRLLTFCDYEFYKAVSTLNQSLLKLRMQQIIDEELALLNEK